jgi:hypothetical protein
MGIYDIVEVRLGAPEWQEEIQMDICGASGDFLIHRVAVW